ncbi:hypothetical protein BpHYR1_048895 [Brachionus plicatilis]|uniref:Uncharacterized protein n=1 Tax=Brachionus plicatilis TaxID=10195 RepID=A0A3M7SRQ9_BRAPC|nr:hypothetical protein BpHYR1_048895 [Brachionus plicatilis]
MNGITICSRSLKERIKRYKFNCRANLNFFSDSIVGRIYLHHPKMHVLYLSVLIYLDKFFCHLVNEF